MKPVNNITLYLPPPSTAEIGQAYVHLVLGLSRYLPGLLNTYLGPAEWSETVLAEAPSLEMLRHQAVALATAVQQSNLPDNRRERLLRNLRALLWLIRLQEKEEIIFTEQVRLLLDMKPELVDDSFFQTAHEALAAVLPGDGPLVERWTRWQNQYTLSLSQVQPFLVAVLNHLRQSLRALGLMVEEELPVIPVNGNGSPGYQQGELRLPQEATVRLDRLYHLGLCWGYGGYHTIYQAMARRYAAGEVECAVMLNLGPDQILYQGLPLALFSELDLYSTAIPALLRSAGRPVLAPDQLQAIHLAEDALQWALTNSAFLLHGQGLRPRAVRRYLMTKGLLPAETAAALIEKLADRVYAVHLFAPLLGGPLVKAWLASADHTVTRLLTDPPVPSTMLFEAGFVN